MKIDEVRMMDEQMNALVEKAITLATAAHAGHVDRYGQPYILHPLHLMAQMETPEERMTAVLHDVVEDTEMTLAELQAEGFPPEVVRAVGLLTHEKERVPYDVYVANLKPNPLARKVKLADLEHNMDIRRLPELGPKDWERLQKYHRAWLFLTTP